MPDIGELVVGAWLTQVEGYDFVVYNQRPGRDLPESAAPKGLAGVAARLGELDVIGLNTPRRESYLAECTTHLDGLLLGSGLEANTAKLRQKLALSAVYADQLAKRTDLHPTVAFWSPKVSKQVLDAFPSIEAEIGRPIDLVANDAYTARVNQLIDAAARHTTATGNDFYRTLQLLTHLSKAPFVELPKRTRARIEEVAAAMPEPGVMPWSEVVKVHRTQAGIRAPRGGSAASIICNTGAHGLYPDRFLGSDVLHYVARGLVGDQELAGDNESLRQAIERGVAVRVFEQLAKNRYVDHGEWYGVGQPLFHLEPGTDRRMIVFTFQRFDQSAS